ncbi:unnamed protein product [Enterobius vermicularis]|uniref:GOLGA2L5 domain-containing protein n=1 Tax=Enterobius vermicularis TaxID=51028 RepID=A0A0N4V8R9_ENTVE|nr:unnamed protein product [Enterobius vermicularis]
MVGHDERIRVRALNAKIRSLETQNAELIEKLRKRNSEIVGVIGANFSERVRAIQRNGSFGFGSEKASIAGVINESDCANISKSLPSLLVEVDASNTRDFEEISLEFERLLDKEETTNNLPAKNETSTKRTTVPVQGRQVQTEKYFDSSEIETLKDELKITQEECNFAKERVQHVECENFELEVKLKETAEKLKTAKEEIDSFEQKFCHLTDDFGAREAEYNAKIASLMKGYDTGNEGLERRDVGVQTLKKDLTLPCDDKSELVDLDQINNNPITENSYGARLESGYSIQERSSDTEYRKMRKRKEVCQSGEDLIDESSKRIELELLLNSRNKKQAEFEKKNAEKEKLMSKTIEQQENEIILLRSAVEKYAAELLAAERQKEEQSAERFFQNALVKAEEQAGEVEEPKNLREESLERRTKEECLLFKQLTEKQKFWETVFSEKENEIASMQKKMDELAAEKHEYDVLKQEFNTLRLKCNIMQEDQTILESELNQYKVKVRENAEEKSRLENLLSEMQNEYSSLKQVYCTERSELEAQKEELRRLHAKLDSLMEERKEGNEELHLDKLEEAVSLMDQLREEYSLLTGEKLSLLKKVDELKVELEVQRKSCFVRDVDCRTDAHFNDVAYDIEGATVTPLESTTTNVAPGCEKSGISVAGNFEEGRIQSTLEIENVILRECVAQNTAMQDTLSEDVDRLLEIKAELETTVEALKGEIWSLNAQLKASIADRDNFSDKLCELTQLMEDEREEAKQRERELEEQKDFAEKSQRQAALAENESNRRLVEWQEKSAEMETSYSQLRNAYDQLTSYYQQLQDAYNVLYASTVKETVNAETETELLQVV